MIDLFLMEALLRAMRPGSRLIMIGDANQLPPVGAGYVFRDIISSERFSTGLSDAYFQTGERKSDCDECASCQSR